MPGDPATALTFADVAAFEVWLEEHHHEADDVWLRIAKKGSTARTIAVVDALDVALCFGWIDGQRRSLDADHYLQRYSPRRPTSSWSQVNVDKVERLVAAGRMREPGFAAITAAKADGRWDAAYASQRTATVPTDLAEALADDDAARARFEALDKTSRYGFLLRLMKARTPATRATQLTQILTELRRPG